MGLITREKKCLTFSLKLGPFHLRFNPIVTILSVIIIWGFVIWCMVDPKGAKKLLDSANFWVNNTWTWLYIGTQDVWAIFILVIFCSKYAKMKLGKDDEEPEFGDVTYFTMLFAAGIGIGLFFFGVAEPIAHYAKYKNRYWGKQNDNVLAQDAMMLVFYHWGIHGWVVYVLVGLLLGFIAYRHDLPMTMRTCFHPLLGDRVFGFMGDLIDTFSVICTMFGVCTSLGIGCMQFNKGMQRVNRDIEFSIRNQLIIIWGITAIATASVISGMKVGIRRLSEICFVLGCVILLVVFFYDETWFLLNLFVQNIGYYFQWIIQVGFHADAFEQLGLSKDSDEAQFWIYDWTIFYWGWWIAWSPFVGMFIAKISKGRTVREFIFYTLSVPVVYVFFWFSVFGGVAIKMDREATRLNVTCDSEFGGKNSNLSHNGLWALHCRDDYDQWFDVIQSYEGISTLMSILSLISILLYFVTSSDSGSLIIDCLSANGDQEPPVAQRVFWALTEGATATALLYSGGEESLKALQAVAIISGLFYTIILNFMCVALWRSMKMAGGDLPEDGPTFSHDIIDPLYHLPSGKRLLEIALSIVAPWWQLSDVVAQVEREPEEPSRTTTRRKLVSCVVLGIPFMLWVVLLACSPANRGLAYVGWAIYVGFSAYASGIRGNIRIRDNIVGNLAEDFFAFLLAYPLATLQLYDHVISDSWSKGQHQISINARHNKVSDGSPHPANIRLPPYSYDHSPTRNGPEYPSQAYENPAMIQEKRGQGPIPGDRLPPIEYRHGPATTTIELKHTGDVERGMNGENRL